MSVRLTLYTLKANSQTFKVRAIFPEIIYREDNFLDVYNLYYCMSLKYRLYKSDINLNLVDRAKRRALKTV